MTREEVMVVLEEAVRDHLAAALETERALSALYRVLAGEEPALLAIEGANPTEDEGVT